MNETVKSEVPLKEITIYDNNRRFVFNNWSKEDFTGKWGGNTELIKVGEIKEYPMYLAFHYAKHFVDREMFRDKKEVMMGVPEERKKYWDKTISEITGDTESPALVALKEKIRAEIEEELGLDKKVKPKKTKVKPEVKEEVSPEKEEEFPDLKK